jgi:SOS-response transcriptional repressor LexA
MDVDTLKRLMKEHGESQADMARLLDLTPDKISKVMKGKRRLTLEEGAKLARYFNKVVEPEPEPKIPIIGLVSAGEWREAIEHVTEWLPSPDKKLSKDAFAVVVEGDSMDLVAQEGEAIIVDPRDKDLIVGKYYVVRNGSGETTFKQYRDNPARLEPCSSNPAHQPIYPGRDVFTVVGRARKRVADL